MAKLLLSISASEATVSVMRRGGLSPCAVFQNEAAGWSAFTQMLASLPRMPAYLMTDVADEEFRAETLPHAAPRARQEMLKRKLSQLYRSSPYATAVFQEREHDKRRDDRFLFVAMNNRDALKAWLEALQVRDFPVAGVFLLPLVSQQLVQQLQLPEEDILLVSLQSAGLRQSYFRNRKLIISRLTPIDAVNRYSFLHEIEKTRAFLMNSRMLIRDTSMTVYFLDPEDRNAALFADLTAEPQLAVQRIGRARLAEKTLVMRGLPGNCADALMLATLGRMRHPVNLAASPTLTRYRRHVVQLGLYRASAATVAGAVLWSGFNFWQTRQLTQESAEAAIQTQTQQRMYTQAAEHFLKAPVAAENLRKAVEVAQALARKYRTPEGAFVASSRVVDQFPSVALTAVEWRRAPKTLNEPRLGAAPGTEEGETLVLDAQIRPFNGDYRAALETAEHMLKTAKTLPNVANASLLKLPLDIRPESGITGNTIETADAVKQDASFKLSLQWKRIP